MTQRIRIVTSDNLGDCVNKVNFDLQNGWELLSEHVVLDPNRAEGLLFVVYLTRMDHE